MTGAEVAQLRPLMFSIAYRMVGSVAEAEDIVQDAYVRMHRAAAAPPTVRSPEAYAATVTTRLAIDHLRSARARRETYIGSWLPEPLLTDPDADPAWKVERDESLSMAFLVLLERLSPVERAVFLLREVFDYPYEQIAEIVDRQPDNCRQLLARARRRIETERPRFEASEAKRQELAARFLAATTKGDTAGLERLLAEDVAFYGDGGGKAPAIKAPMYGREQVVRFLDGLIRRGRVLGIRLAPTEVNGQPGFLAIDAHDRLFSVLVLDIAEGRIHAIRNVLNPDKLRHLGPVSGSAPPADK